MENAVTDSDRLSGIDEIVCILHDNIQNMFWVFDEKYKTLSIYVQSYFSYVLFALTLHQYILGWNH